MLDKKDAQSHPIEIIYQCLARVYKDEVPQVAATAQDH